MYTYHYRLFDRHKQRVISLAVLADEETNWRPSNYGYEIAGCRLSLEFPSVKLLDYETQWSTLEQATNPFGVVVMAHLKTKATHRNPSNRLQWKLRLVRGLYERGLTREEILELFRFINWIMVLPDELSREFREELRSYEEAMRMRYVTTIERMAFEEGRQEGVEKGIEQGVEQGTLRTAHEYLITALQTRFEEVPALIRDAITAINDLSVLQTLFTQTFAISSIAEFQQLLEQITSET
jgi:hypothetical protein